MQSLSGSSATQVLPGPSQAPSPDYSPETSEDVMRTAESALAELAPAPADRARLLSSAVTRAQLMRCAMKGINATKAALLVGCTTSFARRTYADPAFKRECLAIVEGVFGDIDKVYAEKRRDLHAELESQALKSFDDLVTMLEDDELTPAIRMRINQDFLDRSAATASYAPRSADLGAQQLQIAAAAAREMDNVIPITKAS